MFLSQVLILALIFCLWTTAPTVAQQTGQAESLPLLKEWKGDFDGMAKRHEIRALVAYSKTFYFLDQGRQRGASYELLKEFETFINKKLKTKTLKVRLLFVPVRRDQIFPWLVKGLGDIAAANLTITPQREKLADFSDPLIPDIKELLVTGPDASPIKSLDDLAGKEIHVRRSSSYYESLMNLNQSFQKARSFGTSVSLLADLEQAVVAYTTRAAEKLRGQHSLAGGIQVCIRTNPHKEGAPQYQPTILLPLFEPTDDTRLLCHAALSGLRKIYRDGYAYRRNTH